MQRQEIEQSIYQQTHQLPIEDLTEVLRFVEFVQFKSKNRIKSKIPNQETMDAIEAAERGEYEAVGLDEIKTTMGRDVKTIVQTSQFKQDLKRVKKSGRYEIDDLLQVVNLLAQNQPLLEKHKEHNLTGNWKDCKECHVKPDWLLIYQLVTDKVVLTRTGSHSELF